MSNIIYPAFCRAIYPSLRTDMILDRLKILFDCFASKSYNLSVNNYIPLSYHLIKFKHTNKMVNLLANCCSAEIFKHVIIANDVNLGTLEPDTVSSFFLQCIDEIKGLAINTPDAGYKWKYFLLKSFADCKLFELLPDNHGEITSVIFQKFINVLLLAGVKCENTELFGPIITCLKELTNHAIPLVSPSIVVKEVTAPLMCRNKIIDLMVKKTMNQLLLIHIQCFRQMFNFKVIYDINSDWFSESQELHVAEQVLKITDNFDFIDKLLQTIVTALMSNNFHKHHEKLTNMLAISLIRYSENYREKMVDDEEIKVKMKKFVKIFSIVMIREDFCCYPNILLANGKELLTTAPNDKYFQLKYCQIFHHVIRNVENREVAQQLILIFEDYKYVRQ